MKTKNIFKTLVLAAVLVSACGKNEIADDFKGYTLPVTINVTRQGDEGTRATYDESTKKLSFSAGDKLFVSGSYNEGNYTFAGMLDYVSDGKFSGTIYTESEYTGTAEALLAGASDRLATLVPAGYDTYGYLSIKNKGSYYASLSPVHNKAFALTKKAAVEQFSVEQTDSYSSGFALAPNNAIVSFTISGLTANKEVAVSFDREGTGVIGGNVTTSAEGVATFAVGVYAHCELEDCALTVDGNNIAMPTKTVVAGHIYNISRSVAPATPTLTLTSPTVGQVIGSDGKNYAAGASLPTGVTKVAMIAYVSGSNGLAIALADEGAMNWTTAKSTCEAKTPAFTNGTWRLPTQDDWKNMFKAFGGNDEIYTGLDNALAAAGGDSSKLQEEGYYWSSSEFDGDVAWYVVLEEVGFEESRLHWDANWKSSDRRVRACLAF